MIVSTHYNFSLDIVFKVWQSNVDGNSASLLKFSVVLLPLDDNTIHISLVIQQRLPEQAVTHLYYITSLGKYQPYNTIEQMIANLSGGIICQIGSERL